MKEEHNTYDIYYDEEGVFITRDEETGEVKGVGILSFRKRVEILKRVLDKVGKRLPLEIDVS